MPETNKHYLELLKNAMAGEYNVSYVSSIDELLKLKYTQEGDVGWVYQNDEVGYHGYYFIDGEWHLAVVNPPVKPPSVTCPECGAVSLVADCLNS